MPFDYGTEKHRPSAQGEGSAQREESAQGEGRRIKPILTKVLSGGSIEFSNLQNMDSNKLVRMNHRFKRQEGHDAHIALQKGSNLLGNSAI